MSMMDSKGTLARALKDLLAKWEDAKTSWSDAQAREFEKNYLQPLEQDEPGAEISGAGEPDVVVEKVLAALRDERDVRSESREGSS